MTQCCPTPYCRLPTPDCQLPILDSRLHKSAYLVTRRDRDTYRQDPFVVAAGLPFFFNSTFFICFSARCCRLFELFVQPLQKRRQNELSPQLSSAQLKSSRLDSTLILQVAQTASFDDVAFKCSKMTKLISSLKFRVINGNWATTTSPLIDMVKWPSMLPMSGMETED